MGPGTDKTNVFQVLPLLVVLGLLWWRTQALTLRKEVKRVGGGRGPGFSSRLAGAAPEWAVQKAAAWSVPPECSVMLTAPPFLKDNC